MKFVPQSLAARVALSCGCAVAIAGAIVGLVAVLLANRLALRAEDAHLADAARTLAHELSEPTADPDWVADDEARELEGTGIRIAIYRQGQLIAGGDDLSPVYPGACSDLGTLRACAHEAAPWLAVAGRDRTAMRDHRKATALAALIAVLFTTTLGGLGSFALARLVLRPLLQLRAAINDVPEDDPSAANLGPPANLAEIDALRESLKRAFDRLGVALAQSRRFASDAAHELRTPITAILGELELAAEHANEAGQVEIGRAQNVAKRLSILIDRLLIIARPEARLENEEEFDLLEVVEDVLDPMIGSAVHRVSLRGLSTHIRGDRTLLAAMVTNAVENALKFSYGPVRVVLTHDAGGALLAIEDEGPGLRADEREQVFQPFFRSRTSRSAGIPGYGIGLALIAHVVALHRGEVRFAAREFGARLEITLPFRARSTPHG